MKKFLRMMANLKMLIALVFVGMLILYLLGKAIFYREFTFHSLDIVYLMIVATLISIFKVGADYKIEKHGINNKLAVILFGIAVVGIMFLANWLFGFFALRGIQYLYFGLLMVGLYIGACVGFWIISKLEVNSLNICLNTFKSNMSI